MKRTFLVRTDLLAIEPIGKAVRDHGVLRSLIADRIDADTAAIFAVPDMAADGSAINWYTPGLVRAVGLADLADEDKAPILARIDKLRADLEELATALEANRSSENRETAAMLRDLTTLPDERFVFVVNGQPVLTAWSCHHVDGARYRVGYSLLSRPAPPPAADETPLPPPPPKKKRRPWWLPLLWLVFLALVLAILFLLLRACALAPYAGWLGLPNRCAVTQAAESDVARLQQIAGDLENQVRVASKECPSALVPGPAAPEPDSIAEVQNRTSEMQRGALEIALIWDSEDDLDLSVEFVCPTTQSVTRIAYQIKQRPTCGGVLDADANPNAREISPHPAEHIVFVDAAEIPPGPIAVKVTYYKDHPPASPQAAFQLAIQRAGENPQFFEGVLAPQQTRVVTTLNTL